jgi:hypothetical protein
MKKSSVSNLQRPPKMMEEFLQKILPSFQRISRLGNKNRHGGMASSTSN